METMEQQIDRPLVRYGLTEVQYDIKVTATGLRNTPANVIELVQKIVTAHENNCALTVKVDWTLN